MRYGTIHCSCGQQFYFETMNAEIACVKCKKIHNATSYPEKVEEEPRPEEGEIDGVNI